MPSILIARRLTVHGKVQGVFFRAQTQQLAEESDVRGWVANQSDGTVEAWLEGAREAVDAVESWIRDGGPRDAHVWKVRAEDAEPAGHEHFEVRG